MSCTNNTITTCGCGNNPCGCGTSSDDVVYQGPDLSCTGVANCDTLTEVIQSIDGFICSPEMVQTIINNILNNISLYNQFTTIVNNTVDCQTVWDCIEAQTTTTTTTQLVVCVEYNWEAIGLNSSSLVYVNCADEQIVIDVVDVTNNSGTICTLVGSTPPMWDPTPAEGTHILGTSGIICSPTTTTTTTTIACLCYTVTATEFCSAAWINCDGTPDSYNDFGKEPTITICAQENSLEITGLAPLCTGDTVINGPCSELVNCETTTTTTTETPTTTTTTTI